MKVPFSGSWGAALCSSCWGVVYRLSPCGSFPWGLAHWREVFLCAFGQQQPNPGVKGGELGASLEEAKGRGVGGGGFRAAFAKTPYLQVITWVVFHSLPSPVPLLCVCSINWSRLDSCTGVCPRVPVGGGSDEGGSERLSPTPAPGAVRSAAEKRKGNITGSIKELWKVLLTYIKDGGLSKRLGRGSENHGSEIKRNKIPRCAIFLCQPER